MTNPQTLPVSTVVRDSVTGARCAITPPPLRSALRTVTHTKELCIGHGTLGDISSVFVRHFPGAQGLVVADRNTFDAAGREVFNRLRAQRLTMDEPMLLQQPDLTADYAMVEHLVFYLRQTPCIPVVVGAGTLNDLVKLAAHECGRQYLCVATAASMDGYTADGASITRHGMKQTMPCAAARCVVADLAVIARAPLPLNTSGYADLLAKIVAGADWILADAMGVDPIDSSVWQMVQGPLRSAIADPVGVWRSDSRALRRLLDGLMMSGLAMQAHRSTRPAGGAEHRFSHLWEMQGHMHGQSVPTHGHKVGLGTIAAVKLYEALLDDDLSAVDVDRLCAAWPSKSRQMNAAADAFATEHLRNIAALETGEKYITPDRLHVMLTRLIRHWPEVRGRLRQQLLPSGQLKQMLAAAQCPTDPQMLGIDAQQMRASYRQARLIRRRITVLDVAHMLGRDERYLDTVFSKPW